MQAELIILLMSILSGGDRWYPHTLVYSGHGGRRFPLFVRAAQHKGFQRLKIITGIESGDELRMRFKEGYEKHGVNRWTDLVFYADVSFWNLMNMDALDTIN